MPKIRRKFFFVGVLDHIIYLEEEETFELKCYKWALKSKGWNVWENGRGKLKFPWDVYEWCLLKKINMKNGNDLVEVEEVFKLIEGNS